MVTEHQLQSVAAHLFRHESGKIKAVLSRILGIQQLETAEDIVQDTLLQAMHTWSYKGLPANPAAWLMKSAKNRAIDLLRRQNRFNQISPEYAYLLQTDSELEPALDQLFLDHEIRDSQLRMIFACCHPAIPHESQVALTLKTLCGLSNAEIARAFLSSEETIAKRIYRAKEKINSESIPLQVPAGSALTERLDAVLNSLYLLFNEGYNSSHPEQLIREDLCAESMRLCHLLTENKETNRPGTRALLSLICFQSSRLGARLDDQGQIILLQYQDRSNWYRPLIKKGFEYLDTSIPIEDMADPMRSITPYHLEAVIASLHAAAPSFEKTNWLKIHQLYHLLLQYRPGPVVAMNKAISAAYAFGSREALEELLQIRGLEQYYLYHTSLGEMFANNKQFQEARISFEKALRLAPNGRERELVQLKMAACPLP
ncbi:MAG: sigma-70 family RNA polymerase sigma factor [Chitinophagaceae bacterium]|nr:sigma-70 family RNA polymerase sigma factor [Chitinophagaceae bacterium]